MANTVLVLLFLWLSSALGLLVPQHYCGTYFTYATNGGRGSYMGIFTAPWTRSRSLNWQATFEIQGKRNDFVSSLMPYPNEEDSASRLLYTKQAQVFVNFLNIKNELPKLKLLTLNGWTLCSNEGYGPNSTTKTVKYTMVQNKIQQYPNLTTKAPRKVNQMIPIETMD